MKSASVSQVRWERGSRLRSAAGMFYSQRRRGATFLAAALAVGMGFHVVFGQNGLTAYQQKRQNSDALNKQLEDLGDENERLKNHVERLESDPGAIEQQARQQLHYTRPGEVIVTLPNERPAAAIRTDLK